MGARLLLEELELLQMVSYFDPAEFGERPVRRKRLPLLRGQAICLVRLLLVKGNLVLQVPGVWFMPDLILDLLELLDVVRVVHRMVLLEVVECRPGRIRFAVGLRVKFGGS